MKEYYRNCDPEEVDSRGNVTCERRVLHIVSTKLSYEQMRDAIFFTFDDHPIIPKLIRNPNAILDKLLEETNQTFTRIEMKQMKKLEGFSGFKMDVKNEPNIVDLMSWVYGYCSGLTFIYSFQFIIM